MLFMQKDVFCQNFRNVLPFHHQWLMTEEGEKGVFIGKREARGNSGQRESNRERTIEQEEEPN